MAKTKAEALAEFLSVPVESIEVIDGNNFKVTAIESKDEKEYLILTNPEANEAVSETIKQSLWAFQADFIIEHSKLPFEAREMIETFQKEKCEGANDTIEALIDNTDEFIKDAVGADGRGHFVSGYDGDENQIEDYFIYRTN